MPAPSILVVEDERIIAKGIEKQLAGLGYAVAGTAATGEEGVRQAAALRPDLVLMDINLGTGMDGVEGAKAIRRAHDTPVVFLTAFSDPATLERAKEAEPSGYVHKPYETKDLHTAIEIGLYRHRMERRVRENERWLAATLGCIGDAVIATDELGRVRLMNPLAERHTGWPQADALGRDVRDVFRITDAKTRQPVPCPVRAVLAAGRSTELAPGTLLIDRAGGERPIDDSAAPIRDAHGNMAGAVLVFRDVSERMRLEDHLRQAQKMEAVGRLAGGIAHDFNNIMTVITGFSDMLLDPALGDAKRGEYVRQIQTAGQRAAALTQQIMAFSRKQVLLPTVLSLNAVVRDMEPMVRRLIGADVDVVTATAPGLWAVKADPTQVGQIVLNLAANARDAMPQGGRLTVATANAELAAADLPADVPPGRFAVLSVADTGTGIPADVLAHIFDPFFTTKPVGEGTGLGLATVHGIVKQSRGHIAVASRPGDGTEFRVYLPAVDEPPPAAAAARVARPAARGTETILLIEDEEMVRRMTKLVLERDGYAVLEAATGADGVAAAAAYPHPIDLLMTDLVMPQMSGREAADRITEARPGLRVLFVSGYTDDMVVRQGVAAAAVEFLHKPFTPAGLSAKVREVLDRRP